MGGLELWLENSIHGSNHINIIIAKTTVGPFGCVWTLFVSDNIIKNGCAFLAVHPAPGLPGQQDRLHMAQSLQLIYFGFTHVIEPHLILLSVHLDGAEPPLMKGTYIFPLLLLSQSDLYILLPFLDYLGLQSKPSSAYLCLVVLTLVQIIIPSIRIHFPSSLLQGKGLSLALVCQYRPGHLHFFSKFKAIQLRLLPILAYFLPDGSVVFQFAIIECSSALQLSILLPKYIQSLNEMVTLLLIFYESSHGLLERLWILILAYFGWMLQLQVAQVSTLRAGLAEVYETLSDVVHHFIDLLQPMHSAYDNIYKTSIMAQNSLCLVVIEQLNTCFPKNYYLELGTIKTYCQYLQVQLSFSMEVPKWQMMKNLCLQQNAKFKEWQQEKDYNQFHYSHYDWWAFPIDRRSSHGDKYKLSFEDRAVLIKDQQFIAALRSNAILVCESWGYDLVTGEDIQKREKDQCWQDWPIRNYKLSNSLDYFDQEDLFLHAIKYGLKLIQEGNDFTYGPKNLKPLFFKNETFLNRKLRERQEAKQADAKPQLKKENGIQGSQAKGQSKLEQPQKFQDSHTESNPISQKLEP